DTLDLAPHAPVESVSRPVHGEPADAPVYAVLARMRATSTHLVVVRDADTGADAGVVTLTDILTRLHPPRGVCGVGGEDSAHVDVEPLLHG
ncbi:MAG: hypothetical protein M3Y71_19050, partial [Actinomycetota bacterium]|nr:hypothetical protein [Actinomycetota bacterium]